MYDSVRGQYADIRSDTNAAEGNYGVGVKSFDEQGFTVSGTGQGSNSSSDKFISWNWKAGGKTPSKTYYVKVSGGLYQFIDDVSNSGGPANHPALSLQKGGTYTFDQSDSTNNTHPLLFYTNNSKASTTLAGVTVTTSGTPGTAGAYTRVVIASDASTNAMSYQCNNHPNMGGSGTSTNTTLTTTHGQTEFGGSIIPIVSANKEAGFSIVKYVGNGTDNSTVPTGLDDVDFAIVKNLDRGTAVANEAASDSQWAVYHKSLSTTQTIWLNRTDEAKTTVDNYSGGIKKNATNNSLIELINRTGSSLTWAYSVNINTENFILYCWKAIPGYSAFGSYIGNSSTDGPFVYTGFRPAFVMCKAIEIPTAYQAYYAWTMIDNQRPGYNGCLLYTSDAADE